VRYQLDRRSIEAQDVDLTELLVGFGEAGNPTPRTYLDGVCFSKNIVPSGRK
jgi:hypothetical protein